MLSSHLALAMKRVVEMGPESPSADERLELLRHVRSAAPESLDYIDGELVKHIVRTNMGLREAREALDSLRDQHERLTSPPWTVAVFSRWIVDHEQALVWFRGGLRTVTLSEGVDPGRIRRGDDVFLNNEHNLLIGLAPWGASPVGETAEYVRRVDERRVVLRRRDEEIVVETGDQLKQASLREGDLVRWNRDSFMALEKVAHHDSERHFLDEVPDVSEAALGGLGPVLETVKSVLLTMLSAPEKAQRYGLRRRQSLLMTGPPGCGKTLMARVAAAAMQRISGKKCRFAVVKPSEWENPFVGVTAANIRNSFEAFRNVAASGEFMVVFIDEIEATGRTRGHYMGYHGDKHTAALLAELDGFTGRGGVAVIAATNRKDLIDPALLERISDVELQVPRPDLDAAREIFRIHLGEDLPFSPNGSRAAGTRDEIIDVALSRIYGPNSQNELSEVLFRDGSQRTVVAADLMSGRVIEQVCHSVRQRACVRDVKYDVPGIRVSDVEEVVSDVLQRLATTLTPQNIRSYLADLPQDLDVISVRPVRRRVGPVHRLLNHD